MAANGERTQQHRQNLFASVIAYTEEVMLLFIKIYQAILDMLLMNSVVHIMQAVYQNLYLPGSIIPAIYPWYFVAIQSVDMSVYTA